MCGIFGIIAKNVIDQNHLSQLAHHARQRGRDSSGLMIHGAGSYQVDRADYDIKRLLRKQGQRTTNFVMGHSRLITNGLADNQPVVRDGIVVIHNGIIVNDDDIWRGLEIERKYQIDSEVITGLALHHLAQNQDLTDLPRSILEKCKGTVSAALALPSLGKVCLFSNNGSLYIGKHGTDIYFSSE